MLRITREYNLISSKRESLFSWDLLKGIGLAIAIHACLYLGIRIRNPTEGETFSLVPPVVVEIDLGAPRTYCTPIVDRPIEPETELEFLSLPPSTFTRYTPTLTDLKEESFDFSDLEYTVYEPLPDFEEELQCLQ